LVGFGVNCLFTFMVCSYSLLFMFTPSPLLSHATRATPVPAPFVTGIWDALERENPREAAVPTTSAPGRPTGPWPAPSPNRFLLW
jgi:hypothetical protein